MKIIRACVLFCALSAAASAQLQAPESPADTLRRLADGAVFWAEYYSYGEVDRAYFLGRAEGLRLAADLIEASK